MDDLARAMHEDPSSSDNPHMKRIMASRHRTNSLNKQRQATARDGDLGDLLRGLGKAVDPREFVKGAKWSVTHPKERLTSGDRMEFPIGKVRAPKLSPAAQGEAILAERYARSAAKGPRKPGGGRRPAAKPMPAKTMPTAKQTPRVPESPADLKKLLAMSVAKSAPPKGSALRSIMFKLGRKK